MSPSHPYVISFHRQPPRPSFIFTLQEFAAELTSLVDAMSRVASHRRAAAARGNWFKRRMGDITQFLRTKTRVWKNRLSTPEKSKRVVRKICPLSSTFPAWHS